MLHRERKIIMLVALLVFAGVTTVFGLGENDWIDYRLVSNSNDFSRRGLLRDATSTPPTCVAKGPLCDTNCKKVWYCNNSTGVLEPLLVASCLDNQTCNNGVCGYVPSPECLYGDNYVFKCKAEGIFPDPKSCTIYHYCVKQNGGLKEIGQDCDPNLGYHAGTMCCSKKLTNNNCGSAYPIPLCTKPAQTGPLPENRRLYYLCSFYDNDDTKVLYPYIYSCPCGQSYDATYGCR